VIPNGIDVERFRPDQELRRKIRGEWGVGPDQKVIGLVARFDPMKDHFTFLRAAKLLLKERSDVLFVCVGDGQGKYAHNVRRFSLELGLGDSVRWIGSRNDMEAVYNGLDILSRSSSYGESFSNVIAEAMAAGKPCVVTDVGDSGHIDGDTGIVVPPGKADELKCALDTLLKRLDSDIGKHARERVCQLFSRERLVVDTDSALVRLTRKGKRSGAEFRGQI